MPSPSGDIILKRNPHTLDDLGVTVTVAEALSLAALLSSGKESTIAAIF